LTVSNQSRLTPAAGSLPAWRRRAAALTLLAAAASAAAGCARAAEEFELGGYRYSTDRLVQWALPGRLREISGLTLDPDGRLFAHDDEVAVIYELDYASGAILRSFAAGQPPVTGDFEGIAWADGLLYLVTSDGDLLALTPGDDGAHLPYQRHVTGLGRRCEIEGLHYDAPQRLLRLACKTVRERGDRNRTLVLAWSLETASPAPDHDLALHWPAAATASVHLSRADGRDERRLRLSGLTRSSRNGNWIAVAARQHALVEFDADGAVVRAFAIPGADRHPQMEGVALADDGRLIIADEGRKARGRLSVYAAAD
jgi:uncharacterized protein YjiK